MTTEKIISLYIVGTLLFVSVILFIRSIVKFVKNGFMSDDDKAIQKMMKKEVDDLFKRRSN